MVSSSETLIHTFSGGAGCLHSGGRAVVLEEGLEEHRGAIPYPLEEAVCPAVGRLLHRQQLQRIQLQRLAAQIGALVGHRINLRFVQAQPLGNEIGLFQQAVEGADRFVDGARLASSPASRQGFDAARAGAQGIPAPGEIVQQGGDFLFQIVVAIGIGGRPGDDQNIAVGLVHAIDRLIQRRQRFHQLPTRRRQAQGVLSLVQINLVRRLPARRQGGERLGIRKNQFVQLVEQGFPV